MVKLDDANENWMKGWRTGPARRYAIAYLRRVGREEARDWLWPGDPAEPFTDADRAALWREAFGEDP